jgi:rhodanese-related sulfurtransferase
MQQISPAQLKADIAAGLPIQLVDVREQAEHDAFNIGGELIPLSELFEHASKIVTDRPVIVYCKIGIRSQIAIQRLQDKYNFSHLINLQGGMEAWKKTIEGGSPYIYQ